jgi:hypothetical protein
VTAGKAGERPKCCLCGGYGDNPPTPNAQGLVIRTGRLPHPHRGACLLAFCAACVAGLAGDFAQRARLRRVREGGSEPAPYVPSATLGDVEELPAELDEEQPA